jgi:hypothetical protein
MQVNWNQLPLELERLGAEEQVQLVINNLVEAVHWRANVTRSAMMMQFGTEEQMQELHADKQPLNILQDAVMRNPHLFGAGFGLGSGMAGMTPEPKPGAQEQCGGEQQERNQDAVQQLFKNADPALQGLFNEFQQLGLY